MKSLKNISKSFASNSNYIRFCCLAFSLLFLASCHSGRTSIQNIKTADNQNIAMVKAEYSKKAEIAINELSAQRYERASQQFLKLNKEFPSLAEPLANLGLISFVQKDLNAAKSYLLNALEKEKSIAQVYNLLGLIALNERNTDAAEKYLISAVELDEEYSNAHYNLALLYEIYLQDMNNAAIHYQKYLGSIEYKDELTSDWLSGIEAVIQQAE